MELAGFIAEVLLRGLNEATKNYKAGSKLKGAWAGLEACRNKNIQELTTLYEQAIVVRSLAEDSGHAYWALRSYEAEIEWVCGCVSVLLQGANLPIIVAPSQRSIQTAANILGIKT